jgi:hypothetical protein
VGFEMMSLEEDFIAFASSQRSNQHAKKRLSVNFAFSIFCFNASID